MNEFAFKNCIAIKINYANIIWCTFFHIFEYFFQSGWDTERTETLSSKPSSKQIPQWQRYEEEKPVEKEEPVKTGAYKRKLRCYYTATPL